MPCGRGERTRNAVKAFENALQLGARNTRSTIHDPQGHILGIDLADLDAHTDMLVGILHCVVDQVRNRGLDFVRVAPNRDTWSAIKLKAFRRQVVECPRTGHGFLHRRSEFHIGEIGLPVARA